MNIELVDLWYCQILARLRTLVITSAYINPLQTLLITILLRFFLLVLKRLMADNMMKTMSILLLKGKQENTRNLNVKMTKRKNYA